MGGERRQAHLYVHAARRPEMARRRSGHLGGLHRLDQTLGRPRRHGPEADGLDRLLPGRRPKNLQADPERAVWTGAAQPRQAELQCAVHDAQASGGNLAVRADFRLHRLRPVHLQAGRMEARREGRIHKKSGLQAAVRKAELGLRRQGGERRSGGMAGNLRRPDRRERLDRRRGRYGRGSLARPLAGAGSGQERRTRQHQYAGQPIRVPLQLDAAAVRQAEDPASGIGRVQPARFPAGGDRRPQILQDLHGTVHLRHDVRDRGRHGGEQSMGDEGEHHLTSSRRAR